MGLNTYPCSPFPPSTADMEKGDVTEQQKALIATIPGKAQKADIAPEFSAETAYSAGDLVYYNGALYEFTADHAAGAWSTDDTQAATIGSELDQLKSGLTNKCTVAIYNMGGGQTVNILHEDIVLIMSDRGGLYSDGITNRGLNDLVASTQITVTHVDAAHVTVANNSQYGTSIMVIGRGIITITPVE